MQCTTLPARDNEEGASGQAIPVRRPPEILICRDRRDFRLLYIGTCDSKHSKRANTIFRVGRGQQPRPFLSTSQRSMAENLAHFYRDQRSMADATAKALPSAVILMVPSSQGAGSVCEGIYYISSI